MNNIKEVIEKQKRAIITGVAKFRNYFAFYNEKTNQIDFEVQGSDLAIIDAPGAKVTNTFSVPLKSFQSLLSGDKSGVLVRTVREGEWLITMQHLPKKCGLMLMIDPQGADAKFYSEYHLFITDMPVKTIEEKLKMSLFDSKHIVRKNRSGIEIDFGELVIVTINDMVVYAKRSVAEKLGFPFKVPEKQSDIGEFFTDINLVKTNSDFDARLEQSIWVTDKAHFRPLGELLSKGGYAKIVNCSRNLMVWTDGEVTFGPVTPDLYYLDVSEEDKEYCTI